MYTEIYRTDDLWVKFSDVAGGKALRGRTIVLLPSPMRRQQNPNCPHVYTQLVAHVNIALYKNSGFGGMGCHQSPLAGNGLEADRRFHSAKS
ncbi:hypothetical protein IFO70_28080 [Phormidium tenue FACHB-886]|nr:hypothetical protein [Phormidium tenue FACHB-886]